MPCVVASIASTTTTTSVGKVKVKVAHSGSSRTQACTRVRVYSERAQQHSLVGLLHQSIAVLEGQFGRAPIAFNILIHTGLKTFLKFLCDVSPQLQ
eukprot:CAMPEP_0174976794 /NCGR_PEP_ID=MMETSP0004_2-20121128/13228_1 /TAXON_ID=420556 /ORGANISM="Ochromonas sp., Strain CCMP1393" /LENGTH=95 /DNA_ID=CAMNT_0016227859 /DNA_START=31 /DNA_END=318 /DNA_ORIENTATION=-